MHTHAFDPLLSLQSIFSWCCRRWQCYWQTATARLLRSQSNNNWMCGAVRTYIGLYVNCRQYSGTNGVQSRFKFKCLCSAMIICAPACVQNDTVKRDTAATVHVLFFTRLLLLSNTSLSHVSAFLFVFVRHYTESLFFINTTVLSMPRFFSSFSWKLAF